MANVWRCRRVKQGVACGTLNLRVKRKCTACGGDRPKRAQPKHKAILADMPYEEWVTRFGEVCGICGREPSETRRLDRDHDHQTGEARGLLCHRCNRALPNWADVRWLLDAADYLHFAQRRALQQSGDAQHDEREDHDKEHDQDRVQRDGGGNDE